MPFRILATIVMLAMSSLAIAAESLQTQYRVKPSIADTRVKDFDIPSVIMFDRALSQDVPVVLFMPGTGGKPGEKADLAMMNLVIQSGYRVIWLASDNTPSISETCPHNPDPNCSEAFRRMRIYGEGPAPIHNSVAESIVTRLTK